MVENPERILSKTKLTLRPMKMLEVCLELHEKAFDNADEGIHGTWREPLASVTLNR